MSTTQNSFKQKFKYILYGSVILLSASGLVIIATIFSIRKNVENSHKIAETKNNLSACQSSLRGFLLNAWSDTTFVLTGTNKEFETFKLNSDQFEKNIVEVKENISGADLELVNETEKSFQELKKDFIKISDLIKERGFKDLGLEGQLRSAVHKIEKSEVLSDKTKILQLRKHEKDFFLRRDIKYLSNFENDLGSLKDQLASIADPAQRNELENAADSYLTTFRKVVTVETEIGLDKSQGLRGQISALVASANENLEKLNTTINGSTINLIITVIFSIAAIFLIIIGLVVLGLNKLIKPVFEPMHLIQAKAGDISEGDLSVNFDELRDNSVLKELINGFDKIIDKFRTTMEKVEGISSRNILNEIALNSEKDEVGRTLNKIIVQIKKIDDDEKRRTWHNEGVAKFAEILRENSTDEMALYDSITKGIVNYLNANQGALFIIEGEEDKDLHLSMKGCYAYDRKKHLNKRIEFGEGLTGMCWAEELSIKLTDVPETYANITSGVGSAVPTSIIIIPIKFNDTIQGVIELASFRVFEDFEITFTESIAENIGSAIHNMKTNTKTLTLLQKSQEMTEELRAQEEEMRQNMEELQATQEEMERMTANVREELENLRAENKELKANA